MNKVKEAGAAGIEIELDNGIITVRQNHSGHYQLAQWAANAGDWEKLWETIRKLQIAGQND